MEQVCGDGFLTIADVNTSLSVSHPTVYRTTTLPGANLVTLTTTWEFLSVGTSWNNFIRFFSSSLETIWKISEDFLLRSSSHSMLVILNCPSKTFSTENKVDGGFLFIPKTFLRTCIFRRIIVVEKVWVVCQNIGSIWITYFK